MTWNEQFLHLFDRCVAFYQNGNHDFETYYSAENHEFLLSIGCKPREFFDFVEDFCEEGIPSPSTALLVAAVRRDYLYVHPETTQPARLLTRDDIPTFGHELNGIAYLPRILAKARAKLRGELDPDLMFGCGGDRKFLKTHGDIHLADFLRRVWAAHEDDQSIADWITRHSGAPTS
jgi:hypothetical protein